MKNVKKEIRPPRLRKNKRIKPRKRPVLSFKQRAASLVKHLNLRRILTPLGPRLNSCLSYCRTKSRLWIKKGVANILSKNIKRRFLCSVHLVGLWTLHTGWPVCKRLGKFIGYQMRLLVTRPRRMATVTTFRTGIATFRKIVVSPKETLSRIKNVVQNSPHKLAHFFNPRVVRLEEPSRYTVHTAMISLLFVGVAVTAFAVAASAQKTLKKPITDEPNIETAIPDKDLRDERTAWLENTDDNHIADRDKSDSDIPKPNRKLASPKKKQAPLSANYYNPYYIFTQAEAKSVSAYPLADPPGVVVNLLGLEEPEESAENLVGKDQRVMKVKRRVTSGGVRYILHLTQPLKKIETHQEGNVITINPL